MFATANTYTLTLPSGDDLVFGPDPTVTDWVALLATTGITSSVELRESRTPISRVDGEIIGKSYWGSRSIVMDIFLPFTDPQERADKLALLQQCTTMIRTPGLLSWTEQDTAATAKQIEVYLQSFPTLTHNAGPSKTYQITLTAKQPNFDGATLLTFVDGAKDTNHTINNPGDWDAYPTITVTSPFSASAKILNTTTGETFTFSTAFPSTGTSPTIYGSKVEIITNPNNRQVNYYQGTTLTGSFYSGVDVASDFLRLQPGNNTLRFEPGASGTSASKLSLSWRGAWM